MANEKWTPGQWSARTTEETLFVSAFDGHGNVVRVADVCEVAGDAWEANTRLIAAAPELAEQLKSVCDSLEIAIGVHGLNDEYRNRLNAARSLLSKIKGEEE